MRQDTEKGQGVGRSIMATVAGSRGTGRKRMTDETPEAHSVV